MTTTDVCNEVIRYGGFFLRRIDVYTDVLERTGNKRCADFFAFSKGGVAHVEPVPLHEFQALTTDFRPSLP